MKEKVQEIFDKYLFSNKNIDLSRSLEKIIDQVENEIAENKQFVKNCILFHTELLQLKRLDDLEKLNNDKDFKKVRNDLISRLNFIEDSEKFICNKQIEIDSLKYLTDECISCISSLNQKQKKVIKEKGFGISQVRIPKFKKIKSVYCKGKHSNMNPKTNEFCLSNYFFDNDLNYNNVYYLLESMQCMVVNDSYLNYKDMDSIFKILN